MSLRCYLFVTSCFLLLLLLSVNDSVSFSLCSFVAYSFFKFVFLLVPYPLFIVCWLNLLPLLSFCVMLECPSLPLFTCFYFSRILWTNCIYHVCLSLLLTPLVTPFFHILSIPLYAFFLDPFHTHLISVSFRLLVFLR